jgi:uncharacterized UBP type Zn finger protein
MTQQIYHHRVNIPETLTDINGKTITLFGIICHKGESTDAGHYVAYARKFNSDVWFFYDDLDNALKEIGVFENMKKRREISTHGVLYFYGLFT